ncbi:MAG: electron transfer flavoprotein subunit alpha/FixB family protein [Flavobacteriales bacterium]|nr:electron transfer flavoprotein subunit alpha/FixB family protein [Flavobacteriales bacterium]
MAILVFADNHGGKITKSSLEAVGYAAAMGGDVTAVTFGSIEGDGGMGNYGASKVIVAGNATSDPQQLTRLVVDVANAIGASDIVFSHDTTGKSVAPRVAARMDAGLVAGATAIPSGKEIKKNVFSGKAFAYVEACTDKRVISVLPNSFGLKASGGSATVEQYSGDCGSAGVIVKDFKPTSTDGSVPLPEAEMVVSAGRGMKGPENWGIIEDLAGVLGATTACSRPVADIGWRPHHEHVGQTGIAIRPNLYIAVGISGAIQHLAGVNGSKVIVVINTDPEAPFFKAADYGIVGDAFEVVPKLTEALKAFKSAH